MTSLDHSAQGVVFILDDTNIVKGLLTDGDIRRALLTGGGLDDRARNHMNRDFMSGSTTQNRKDNVALLNDRIRSLPVVDQEGRLVDILFWSDLYRLPVMEPELQGNELEYVTDCITSNWISSQGKYVEQFQNAFAEFLNTQYALCVANGTVALHLAMSALGIGQNHEVIVPDLTFVSPASMALLCGAKPVFVDVDRTTWTMDPASIEERISDRTKAIVPVHLYGHPCDMDPIMDIARRYNLYVIEDCAEALGAEYKGRKVGTLGDIGTFSFFANKVITTGEGGMCCTNNSELNSKMMVLRDHGMRPGRRYWHEVAGYNYRLTNMQAAIGLAQLERIDAFLLSREKIVARYDERFRNLPGITLPPRKEWGKNIFWLYSILIDEELTGINRDALIKILAGHGIDTRPLFHPLHGQPPFYDAGDQNYPNAEWLALHGISLPTWNDISMEDVDKVCEAISSAIESSSVFKMHY